MLSPKDQQSLHCCVPNLCPFTLLAVSQRPAFPSVLCTKFVSIHVTSSLPKTSNPFIVVLPVCVHSRYQLCTKDQHSLKCCVPSLFPFTLLAVSQRPAFISVSCSQFVSIHVTCCLPKTSILSLWCSQYVSIHFICCLTKTSIPFSFLFPVCVHSRYLLSPKVQQFLQWFFPVYVHSLYLLSPKVQQSFQCCVLSFYPFTLIVVSQRIAILQCCVPILFPFTLLPFFQRTIIPSMMCSQFTSIHVTFCLPKTSIPFSVVFAFNFNSRYLLSPKDQHSLQCCVPVYFHPRY